MIQIRRIVCPTDFSPTGASAVDYAAEMARSFGADLVLLHVIPELNYPLRSFGMASSFPHMQAELHQRADEELIKEKERIGNGLRVQALVRNGEVHVQVLEAAKDVQADLVVMGTHGHTGLKHALLGSTAERVVRLCPCPVLTVRPHGHGAAT